MIVLYVLGGIFVLALAVFLLAGRTRTPGGRLGRTMRVGRLTARLSASWLGAKVRRLFAGKEGRKRIDEAARKANAEHIARTMGEMKGALMKLGQILSFITDEVPPEYRKALEALQAEAPPMDFPLIRDVAEAELGKPLERAFARFDEKPIASASIGQVHRAKLPTGEEVVVKVQYPGVAEAIRGDMANVGVLYRMVAMFYPNLDPAPVIDEMKTRVIEELDYVNEAKNQHAFFELYQGHPEIRVPRVHFSHSTARVLTSEYVAARRFAEILNDPPEARSRYGQIIYKFVFGNIFRHAMFNADPHPGNYLFDGDGRVAFLDFGCVKHFPRDMLDNWRRLVTSHVRGDKADFRKTVIALEFVKPDCPLETDLLYDYWAYFYAPIERDEEFTFTREYNSKSLKMVFAPDGKFAPIPKHGNMPRDFVFVNRIQWGVYSVLAQLEARANWFRLQQQHVFDPSWPGQAPVIEAVAASR